jgi:hypothetical protein
MRVWANCIVFSVGILFLVFPNIVNAYLQGPKGCALLLKSLAISIQARELKALNSLEVGQMVSFSIETHLRPEMRTRPKRELSEETLQETVDSLSRIIVESDGQRNTSYDLKNDTAIVLSRVTGKFLGVDLKENSVVLESPIDGRKILVYIADIRISTIRKPTKVDYLVVELSRYGLREGAGVNFDYVENGQPMSFVGLYRSFNAEKLNFTLRDVTGRWRYIPVDSIDFSTVKVISNKEVAKAALENLKVGDPVHVSRMEDKRVPFWGSQAFTGRLLKVSEDAIQLRIWNSDKVLEIPLDEISPGSLNKFPGKTANWAD